MLSVVKEAFEKEKEFQESAEISCQVTIDGYTDFIFVNRFGNVHNQGTLNRAIKRIIRDCNQEIFDNEGATEPLPPKGGRFNQRLKPPKVDRIPARRYLLFSQQFFLSTQVSIFCYLHNVIFMSYVQYDDFL